MTISVTPDEGFAPPRVQIEVSVESGGVMQSVAVYRETGGQRELIRSQPSTGLDSRIVYDYEAPYEVPVTYSWESSYVSPTALSDVLAETWTNLSAWTVTDGVDGSWAASGGKLVRQNGPDRDAVVSKSFTPSRYRVTFAAAPTSVAVIDFGGFQINLESSLLVVGSQSRSFAAGSGGWTVDVTPTGVSLVTDSSNISIAASGVTMSKIEFRGALTSLAATGQLDPVGVSPWARRGIVVASSRVFVLCYDSGTDYRDTRVSVFDLTGAHLTDIDFTVGSSNGQFSEATAIAFDGTRILIADRGNHRVQRFTIGGSGSGTTLTYYDKFGSFGSGDGQFSDLRGIACDGSGNIYTTDLGLNRVTKFTSAGAYSAKWGSRGSGNGQFFECWAITVVGSSVYVADVGSAYDNGLPRIQKFSTTGTYQSGITLSAYNGWCCALTGLTGIVIAATADGRIQTLSATLELSTVLPAPGNSFASEVRITVSGTTLYEAGRFSTPDRFYTINAAIVDDVTVQAYGGTLTIEEMADPIVLEPAEAWLIHPALPTLSVPIAHNEASTADFQTFGDIYNDSTSTIHRIMGSDMPVVVTASPRATDELDLTIRTATADEERAVVELLRDQTPILIRVPPSWLTGFVDGFYSVGRVRRSRFAQWWTREDRSILLPLVAVDSPEVTVDVQSSWTYAVLATAFVDYAAVRSAYSSYADLIADRRR